jgi:hypothetical protein
MVQWLFLNWINTKSTAPAVSRQNYPVTDALTDETETALALVQFAKTRAKFAFDPAVW